MKYLYVLLYGLLGLSLLLFSYGFVDPHLSLSHDRLFIAIQHWLSIPVFSNRSLGTALYIILVTVFFLVYYFLLFGSKEKVPSSGVVSISIATVFALLVLSFPAFSYDLFNYILTAKVTFTYRENPYVVMPIEIRNEPMLAYTRAANKTALYGPVWIALTAIPHFLGMNNIWLSIIMFKFINGLWYLAMLRIIFKFTRSLWNVIFFAFNPLVLFETLVSGHNDITMMVLAVFGFYLLRQTSMKDKISGSVILALSILVKGATTVLVPLIGLAQQKDSWEKVSTIAYWLLFSIFLLTPFREELYPWYAVWFLVFAALLPKKRARFIHSFSIVVSLSLLLRYIPYLYTREYGRTGPLWRFMFTIIPISLFFCYLAITNYIALWQKKRT